MVGWSWQRCQMQFMRYVIARVLRTQFPTVIAAIQTIFAQPDASSVATQFERITDMLNHQLPDIATMLGSAHGDLLTFSVFSQSHWRKIWTTNPLELHNCEIKRCRDVVGVFPNDEAVTRLVMAVMIVTHREWRVSERRYLSETSMAELLRD
jgi:transposase-like protein